jgi:RecA/RadA recombinase
MAKKKDDINTPEVDDSGRLKALKAMEKDLTKRFGEGSIQVLGQMGAADVNVIPSGSLTVDIAIGVGGIPRGRITEIYGPESSGKTTLCLHTIAEAQKRGGVCAFVDMEHALDPNYAKRIGVDLDRLYISQPDTGEQALEITESLIRSGALDVVAVDSVAALVPRAEIEGEMGDAHVGLQARLMSQALRKLSGAVKHSNTALMFTNQLREKIGVMFGCFQGDAPVMLADGTTRSIREIVEQQLPAEVMSFDVESGTFEPRPVVNWFDNGETDEFLRITVSNVNGQIRSFDCTPNHEILTPAGYQHAGELEPGTELIAAAVLETATAADTDAAPACVPQTETVQTIETVNQFDDMRRFDIEVEGNHCYLVDGVVVHNSPETTSGGRALKFYASVRLDIRRIQSIKASGENIGNRTRVRVKKNKVAPPFREAEFDIMFYENGISKLGEIIDLGADVGIIEKRGAYYRYNDELLGQGRQNSKDYLREENPAMADEIEDRIREHFGLPTMLNPRVESEDDDE